MRKFSLEARGREKNSLSLLLAAAQRFFPAPIYPAFFLVALALMKNGTWIEYLC
jgi:hypothetical protein